MSSKAVQPRGAIDSPTSYIDVDGTKFAYREFGPSTGVPVVFLHHFTAVIDDWDPRVIDGISAASFDLAHRLPNASLRIYPDSGHGGVFQHHEQFVPHVLEFLR